MSNQRVDSVNGRSVVSSPEGDDEPDVEVPDRVRPPARRPRRAGLAALLVFVAVCAGAIAAVEAMPTGYAATSVVSFLPRPDSAASAETVQLVGQKYVVLATAAATLQAAGRSAGVSAADLRANTSAVLAAGTGNLEVTVTWPDRVRAARAANAVAAVLVRDSVTDQLVEAEATSPAVASTAEVTPPRMLLRVAGVLAGLLAALLVWTVAAGARARAAGFAEREPAPWEDVPWGRTS